MPLKLNGKPFEWKTGQRPELAQKSILATLKKLPSDEVLDTPGLRQKAKVGKTSVQAFVANPKNKKYYVKAGAVGKLFFGSPRALRAALELVGGPRET